MNSHSSEDDRPRTIATLTVRGRPVAFVANRWGGALHAVERGHFPVSHTGYRSLSYGSECSAPTAEQLEVLAVENDRQTAIILRDCDRALATARGDSISRYIHVSGPAMMALDWGFFAQDNLRIQLWQHAYRLYSAISDTPALQPTPNGGAWHAEHCTSALTAAQALAPWISQLLAGNILQPPATDELRRRCAALSAFTYLDLPPRPTAEPTGSIPSIERDFAFAEILDAGNVHPDDTDPDDEDLELEDPDQDESPTPPLVAASIDSAQLSLF